MGLDSNTPPEHGNDEFELSYIWGLIDIFDAFLIGLSDDAKVRLFESILSCYQGMAVGAAYASHGPSTLEPEDELMFRGMNEGKRLLLKTLLLHASDDLKLIISKSELSELTGLSTQTIKRNLGAFEKEGLLVKETFRRKNVQGLEVKIFPQTCTKFWFWLEKHPEYEPRNW